MLPQLRLHHRPKLLLLRLLHFLQLLLLLRRLRLLLRLLLHLLLLRLHLLRRLQQLPLPLLLSHRLRLRRVDRKVDLTTVTGAEPGIVQPRQEEGDPPRRRRGLAALGLTTGALLLTD